MKKSILMLGLLTALVPAGAVGATTVTVEDDQVTVSQTPRPATTVETVNTVGSQTVVMDKHVLVPTAVRDARILEGEVIRVDHAAYELTVRDIDGRERPVILKRGTINNYKVDDYVVIHLTPDLSEAMKIQTRHASDVEGEIVGMDRATGTIIVRGKDGISRTIAARPDVASNYKIGDYVRLFVVFDNPNRMEAKMIRVR